MRFGLKVLVGVVGVGSVAWLGCTEMGELEWSGAPREAVASEKQAIVGGTAALPFSNPWHARIHRQGDDSVCSGALISLGWVLTTARCVAGHDASTLSITVGTIYRNSSRDGVTAQTFTPRRVIIHPSYQLPEAPQAPETPQLPETPETPETPQTPGLNGGALDYDIALLELPANVVPNSVASPVALSHTDPLAGRTCDLSGFGATGEGGGYQAVLRRAYVNILPRRACKSAYGNGAMSYRQICAGLEEGGRGGCEGDSGAPLVLGSLPPKLVGLYSYSRGCAQQGAPDVVTNVFAFADWIDSVTGLPL